ncbi:MAG: YraN family protein [Polyangiaceae bacterium]
MIDYLFVRGFVILAANLRLGYLELDVVARRGPLAVIVEVRTRGTTAYEKSLASLNGKKQMRLLHAADRLWRRTLSKDASIERLRIDVAAVTFDARATHVEYIEGAISA